MAQRRKPPGTNRSRGNGKAGHRGPSGKRPAANAGGDDGADADDAFAELLAVAAEAIDLLQAAPEEGMGVELAPDDAPPLLVILQGGAAPAMLCLPAERAHELSEPVPGANGDAGDTPDVADAFGISFAPPEAIGMPAEMALELRGAGWPAEVFPVVRVNDEEGFEVEADPDDVRAVATVLAILLDADLAGAVKTGPVHRVLHLDGDGVPLTVTWLPPSE